MRIAASPRASVPGNRVHANLAPLQHSERHGEDHLRGLEAPAVLVFERHPAGLPGDRADLRSEDDLRAGGLRTLCEECGQPVVTLADAPQAVAFDRIFGRLLPPERQRGGHLRVRRVEAFHVGDFSGALPWLELYPVQKLDEGAVRAGEILELF